MGLSHKIIWVYKRYQIPLLCKKLKCQAYYIANNDKINFYANKIQLAGNDPKKYGI